MSTMTIRRIVRAWPVALLLLGMSGCFNPFDPRIAPTTGIYVPPPTPNSPQNVIRLFEWCWKNRDITVYKEILTEDFRFVFALGDSAGNQFRDEPVTREMELNIARNLFVGGGSAPPASSIFLVLDPTLRALPDSRPGKNPKWHNEIVTSVDLSIKTDGGAEYRIMGNARFFVVRGDSARIPQELGFRPDSTRWYIDQWNDETLQGGAAATVLGPAGPAELRVARPGDPVTVPPVARAPRRPRASAALAPPPFEMTWGQLNALYAR
jgi:hypothetical protein